jgi:predicted transcriptional regulator
MITKDKAIEVIKSLPAEFSIEELMDRLILLNKVETGIKQAKSGETYTTDEAKKIVREWSK